MNILDKCIISYSWRYDSVDPVNTAGIATWNLVDAGFISVPLKDSKDVNAIEKMIYHAYYTGLKEGLKYGATLMTEQLQEVENNEASESP
jgi:hypothetical protein